MKKHVLWNPVGVYRVVFMWYWVFFLSVNGVGDRLVFLFQICETLPLILHFTWWLCYFQIFDLFDVKRKGVIDFGDFVRSLNVFHPNASREDKINCKFVCYTWLLYVVQFEMKPKFWFLNILISSWFGIEMQLHLASMIWMAQDILSGRR